MSADLLGRGRSLLPYAHCKNIEAWWWKTTPPPPPQKKKKKKKKFGSLPSPQSGYATPIMVFFAHLFLLIYSSQKVPTSLKFYRALHIIVLHMHRKFDVDSIDSFWDTEEQSTQLTRRKERKKERKKERRITGNKKNIKVKNKKSHHYKSMCYEMTEWISRFQLSKTNLNNHVLISGYQLVYINECKAYLVKG